MPLGLPAAVLIVVWLLVRKRNDIRTQNLVAFFFLAYVIALLLFARVVCAVGRVPRVQ